MSGSMQRQALRDSLNSRFKGKKIIKSKVHIRYKKNLEREYRRIIEQYFALLIPIIQKHLEELFEAPTHHKGSQSMFRLDDRQDDFLNYIKSAFRKMNDDFHQKEQSFNLTKKIDKLGELTRRLSANEWKRTVTKTLGIDLREDYFMGEFYREQLKQWSADNVGLIGSLPDDALAEMQSVVEQGYLEGKSTRDIVKDMQERFNVSRNKATFYAVDQMAKLNASITQAQQRDCGVEEYEWSSSGDQRVRDRHRELNGTRQRWDSPPIVDKKTGRRAHPGEDYRCRCVALPIFNLETVDLPIKVTFKR